MKELRGAAIALGILALVALSAGCSRSTRVTDPAVPIEVVTGVVTEIVDLRPLDGGIDLTVRAVPGGDQVFSLGGLRIIEPNSQPDLELHALVSTIVVGDRVVATGERRAQVLLLTGIRRLPRP